MKLPKFGENIVYSLVKLLLIGLISAYIGKPLFGNFIFSQDELSSFFSSIVQGFLGLAAFMGAVAFFALESKENKLTRTAEELSTSVDFYIHRILLRHHQAIKETKDEYSYLNKMASFLGITLNSPDDPRALSLKKMYETWTFSNEVKDRTMCFVSDTFWFVIFSIIFLVFSDEISKNNNIAVFTSSLGVGVSLFVLGSGAYFIRRVIGYGQK